VNGPWALLSLGFLLGMRHATDSDHVVAVTTLVSRERRVRGAALLGALWGLGHTATLMAVGLPVVLFGLVIPERLGLSLEFSVALMLMLLGGWNLAEFLRRLHVNQTHDHALVQEPEAPLLGKRRALRSMAVGVVHGLAGSAAVALLVLTQVHSVAWAAFYLALFGAGTMVGMAAVTAALALPMSLVAARSRGFLAHFGWLSGALSLGFGLFLVYRIGFVDGLFVPFR
jgi:high-affinity nickel-transport protein